MISIDSVNILISLYPSMHSEVPYPTPTQWVLFSFVFLQQIPTLQTIFSRALFWRRNGSNSKWLASKGILWKALEMWEIWLWVTHDQSSRVYSCRRWDCPHSLTSAPVPDNKVDKVIQNLWNCYLFSKSIRKGNYFFLPTDGELLHYLPTIVAGNFLCLNEWNLPHYLVKTLAFLSIHRQVDTYEKFFTELKTIIKLSPQYSLFYVRCF